MFTKLVLASFIHNIDKHDSLKSFNKKFPLLRKLKQNL